MKIGFAGPIDTQLLSASLELEELNLPEAYSVPMNALLVSAFLEKGHEVVVFGLSENVSEPQTYTSGKLKICLGRYRKGQRARDFFRVERNDLMQLMRDEPCDILNAHWTYEFALAALAVDRNAIVTVRDWAPEILKQMPDVYRFVRLLMALKVYLRGKTFTVNSPYMKRLLDKWTWHTGLLVANGLADRSFEPVAQWRDATRERTIIAINRGFFERKNIPTLLRAFAHLREKVANVRLLLIGDGSEEGAAGHTWASENSLDEGVDFLGSLPYLEVQSYLRESSLLVHPSYEESFGMVLIEAMAKGVPVIAGKESGAVPWVLDDGRAGVLVDVSNPETLAGSMTLLLNDEKEWQKFSQFGYKHAKESFGMSSVADKYLEIYEATLSS
ncbi:MAG: glycosyltransferase family 4 protein [Verrucomicrobiota bacterium]